MGWSFKVGKFGYYGDSLKNPIFSGERWEGGGGFIKNQYIGGISQKKGEAWTVCRFTGELAPQCTLWFLSAKHTEAARGISAVYPFK